MFKKPLIQDFAALGAGALLPLAFAPFGVYSLAILLGAALLFLWLHVSPRKAAWRGFLFGLGYFGVGISWVYISIHNYGHSPMPLAFLITALLIMYMALFPTLQGYLLTKFFPNNNTKKLLLAYPASWVLVEWLREWFLTGFPWLNLGYSQISSPLRGFAPIFGVYGVTFAAAFMGGALVLLYLNKKPRQRLYIILALFLLWFGCEQFAHINWTKPITGDKINVSLIQGNVPQEMKWQPEELPNILQRYYTLTKKHWNSSIIIWPEAAIPAYPYQVESFLKDLSTKAKAHKATLLLGIPLQDPNNSQVYYNGIITLGINHEQYAKRHLVPFGEYVPFDHALHNLLDVLKLPMSSFSSGSRQQAPLTATDNIKIAPFICYEIVYPRLALDQLPEANLLLTISDDSWFGESIALAQQLEISRMRSLETGRYQLVSTNTGISAVIDAKGNIVTQAPVFEQAVISAEVVAMQGKTPWVAWGHYCWWWLAILCLTIARINNND